ncbi:MAG TPA: ribose 5-phosphate isomerase B [Bacteroidales bacterium]|nr:ribose 5-phosphate isomerase B [Bacteroidales bacterium]HPT51907.1 ribose 5-phosphate isomerase B [Bacteroidales bacterium]
MEIIIAADHAGFELKEAIKQHFSQEFQYSDLGTFSSDSVDYPDFAHPLAEKIAQKKDSMGILICGTGNGVAMTANKHADVRAALAWNTEIAVLARQHNNANVLVLPARFISAEKAFEIVATFFQTAFEGGRHERRVNKINIH